MNGLGSHLTQINQEAGSPPYQNLHLSFGIVEEVNCGGEQEREFEVRIRQLHQEKPEPGWHTVINRELCEFLFGGVYRGQLCKVYTRGKYLGKNHPRVIVEIIANSAESVIKTGNVAPPGPRAENIDKGDSTLISQCSTRAFNRTS